MIWLVHISAIVGISLGYKEWFVAKTGVNLLLIFGLFIWNYPIDNLKKVTLTFLFIVMGMGAEWVGVHYGFPFGNYAYGANLGPKLDGVPYLIGVNWAVLTLASAGIADRVTKNNGLRVVLGAFLMVLLDLAIEPIAPLFDYWTFENGAPIQNYNAWFGLAAIMHFLLRIFAVKEEGRLSVHVFLATALYFTYFYLYYEIL